MSWQVYVDSNLVGTGNISRAAILGIAGGVWAKTAGFEISPTEQAALTKGYSDPQSVQASGIKLANEKYFVIQANERSIYGKKKADGVVTVKTAQAIIVGEYVAPTQPGEATKIVENLADYLIGLGY